jgi:hypothetical protein
MISRFPSISKGWILFRAQSIVEKQIQSDQGALWKRKNVMNFEAQAALDYRQSVLSLVSERKTSLAKFSLYITLFSKSQKELISSYESLSPGCSRTFTPCPGTPSKKGFFFRPFPKPPTWRGMTISRPRRSWQTPFHVCMTHSGHGRGSIG